MSKTLNVCFLGASEVGKSSLISSFQNSYFDEGQIYLPTIENKYSKLYTYNKQLFNINTYDTSGSLECSCIVPSTIKQCEAFVIVYSLTDRNSCDSITMYKEMIKNCFKYLKGGDNVPIILVGNKVDGDNYKNLAFTETEIQELSKYINLPYIEASSKDIQSVQSIFNLLIDTINFKEKQLKKQQLRYKKQLRNENNRNFFQKIFDLKLK
ncbi:hypothetical protein RB653_004625 [Dictyostelium firmibasis]|uniref:Small GTPase n=1 Tax=Dictyostelium firmibasis TaxID=79012 RepID=A0AAN7UAU8_9MYCE